MIDFMVENVEVTINSGIETPKKFVEIVVCRIMSLAKEKEIPIKKITFFAEGSEPGVIHLTGITDDGNHGFMYLVIQVVGTKSGRHVSVQFLEVKAESIERATF